MTIFATGNKSLHCTVPIYVRRWRSGFGEAKRRMEGGGLTFHMDRVSIKANARGCWGV